MVQKINHAKSLMRIFSLFFVIYGWPLGPGSDTRFVASFENLYLRYFRENNCVYGVESVQNLS